MDNQCSQEDEGSDRGNSCVDRLMRANVKEMERLTPALLMGQKVAKILAQPGGGGSLNIR